MGPDGNASFDAGNPAVAYNPSADEYLVVWEGDDDTGTLVDEEVEIFGQLLAVPEPSHSVLFVSGLGLLVALSQARGHSARRGGPELRDPP
jgi:hypothetical protein